ncbi:hypothetical protein EMIT0111MI5_60002 [Burkholderia sp. IT-111MI5]
MPPRMPVSPSVRRRRPSYTVASNGTYTVSPMLARPNQGVRRRDSAARFCLAFELSEPHESCSWEMI